MFISNAPFLFLIFLSLSESQGRGGFIKEALVHPPSLQFLWESIRDFQGQVGRVVPPAWPGSAWGSGNTCPERSHHQDSQKLS